jgi:hypothetical protein
LQQQGYQEKGAPGANRAIAKTINRYLKMSGGAEIAKLYHTQNWLVRPSMRLGYTLQHSLTRLNRGRFSFVGQPGSCIMDGDNKDKHLFDGAISLSGIYRQGFELSGSYTLQANGKDQTHAAILKLKWRM